MRHISKTHYLTFLGSLAGATAGYFYYHFVGCASGTCAITSSPIISTLYGAVMGGLFINSIISFIHKNKKHGK